MLRLVWLGVAFVVAACARREVPPVPTAVQGDEPAPVPFVASEPAWQPLDRCDASFADVVGCDVRPARPEECQKPCRHPVVAPECSQGWCRLPRGCFIAGSPPCEVDRPRYDAEPTQMTLTHDFALRQTELTQAEWMAVGFPNPSGQGKGGESDCIAPGCPVGNVSWFEMLAYSNRLSELHGLPPCFALHGCTGAPGQELTCQGVTILAPSIYACEGYRPPTAMEWEYAVRGGTATSFFTGAMNRRGCFEDKGLMAAAWYCANSQLQTRPVKGRVANPWGLHDMLGNTSEWVMDAVQIFPKGPLVDHLAENDREEGFELELRAFRGGAVHSSPDIFLASLLLEGGWNARGPTLGFRIVRTLPAKP